MKYYVGIDLGVTEIKVGVVDKYGRLIRKDSTPTLKERSYEEIIKDAADLVLRTIDNEDIDRKDVKYIGVGSPGIPNNKEGIIVRNYTLNFHNTPIRSEFKKYINLPIYIENDANCAALAESVAGAAEDYNHSVLVKIGTGIGGGIIVNNSIYSGFNYAGAELGHMVISMGGEKCTCGRCGCWEAYASGTALLRQIKDAVQKNQDSLIYKNVNGDYSKINERTLFDASKRGDEVAKEVLSQYLSYLSEGIANLINILQPDVFVIGGEISKEGDALIKPLREKVYEKVYSKEVAMPEIKTAQMGNASVMIGAAMLELYKA